MHDKVGLLKEQNDDLDIVLAGEFVLSDLVNYCDQNQTGLTPREIQGLYLEFLPDAGADVVACDSGILLIFKNKILQKKSKLIEKHIAKKKKNKN